LAIAGDRASLGDRLGVEGHVLGLWLAGRATIPQRVFLAVVDMVLQDDIARSAQDRRAEPRQTELQAPPRRVGQ
jgi:hypothetical protein